MRLNSRPRVDVSHSGVVLEHLVLCYCRKIKMLYPFSKAEWAVPFRREVARQMSFPSPASIEGANNSIAYDPQWSL